MREVYSPVYTAFVTLTEGRYHLLSICPCFLDNTTSCAGAEQLSIPTVSFAPGYEDVGHAYDEFVYAKDLVNMAKVYGGAIVDYVKLLGSSLGK